MRCTKPCVTASARCPFKGHRVSKHDVPVLRQREKLASPVFVETHSLKSGSKTEKFRRFLARLPA